jgi:hypothetical protein
VGDSRVAFSSGNVGSLLILQLSGGTPIDTIQLEIESKPPRDKDLLQYAMRQARATTTWTEEQVQRYIDRVKRDRSFLRETFSHQVPKVTQLFTTEAGKVWVRHFDPSAWPHGLSDRWTVVDLEDSNTRVIEISGLGVVHDMRDSGRELVILSSVFPAQGEAEVRVSTFGHFIRPPQQSAGLEAASNDRTRTEQGTPSGSESGGLEL